MMTRFSLAALALLTTASLGHADVLIEPFGSYQLGQARQSVRAMWITK